MGRVEDNCVLEWHLALAFATKPPLLDMDEAVQIIGRNRRASHRLILLFRLWRELNDNDLNRAASVFGMPDHPLVRSALEIVATEEGALSPNGLVRRLLGRRAAPAADWLERGLRYAARLSGPAKDRECE